MYRKIIIFGTHLLWPFIVSGFTFFLYVFSHIGSNRVVIPDDYMQTSVFDPLPVNEFTDYWLSKAFLVSMRVLIFSLIISMLILIYKKKRNKAS